MRISALLRAPNDARLARLRLAIAATSAARLVRLLTQTLIIGISVRHLGATDYGIWLTAVAAFGWLSWGQAGLAPGLVNAIAAAEARKNPIEQGVYFTTALTIVLLVATIMLTFGIVFLSFTPSTVVWFSTEASAEARKSDNWVRIAQVCLTLALLKLPLALVESSYVGLQKLHILRLWDIGGQLISLATVIFLVYANVTGVVFILISGLVAESGTIGAGLYLTRKLKPNLRPSLSKFDLRACRGMLNLSTGFLFLQIAGYLVLQSGTLILAGYHGAAAVPAFALVWQLYQMASGLWMMFVSGLWGALGEARATGEWDWIVRIQRRLVLGSMVLSISFSIGLLIAGQWIVNFWSGGHVVADQKFLIVMAVMCSIFTWAIIHGQIMSALSIVWKQVIPALANGILVLVLGMLVIPDMGVTGLALSLLVGCCMTTAWIYPVYLRRQIKAPKNVAS